MKTQEIYRMLYILFNAKQQKDFQLPHICEMNTQFLIILAMMLTEWLESNAIKSRRDKRGQTTALLFHKGGRWIKRPSHKRIKKAKAVDYRGRKILRNIALAIEGELYSPGADTLDILAIFLGYRDFGDWFKNQDFGKE